jgi:hypothetical protein
MRGSDRAALATSLSSGSGVLTPYVSLRAAEPESLDHMNTDHLDTLVYVPEKGRRLTGVGREGADLRRSGEIARLTFLSSVTDVSDIRQTFVALAQTARRDVRSH